MYVPTWNLDSNGSFCRAFSAKIYLKEVVNSYVLFVSGANSGRDLDSIGYIMFGRYVSETHVGTYTQVLEYIFNHVAPATLQFFLLVAKSSSCNSERFINGRFVKKARISSRVNGNEAEHVPIESIVNYCRQRRIRNKMVEKN